MGLFQALRGGEVAVKQFMQAYGLKNLPSMAAAPSTVATGGWDGKVCAYFDPLEALDFMVSLRGKPEVTDDRL